MGLTHPILLSAALLVIGLWARGSLTASPAFASIRPLDCRSRGPLAHTLREHPRTVTLSIGIATSSIAFGFLIPFVVSHAVATLGLPQAIVVGATLAGIIDGLFYSMLATLFVALFPTPIRSTGMPLGFETGSVLGGLTPLVAAIVLRARQGQSGGLSLLLSGLCALTLLCLAQLRLGG